MTLELTNCLFLSLQDITHWQFVPVRAHPQYLTHPRALSLVVFLLALIQTAGGNRCILLPLPPMSALALGRREHRMILVLWAASQAGPRAA